MIYRFSASMMGLVFLAAYANLAEAPPGAKPELPGTIGIAWQDIHNDRDSEASGDISRLHVWLLQRVLDRIATVAHGDLSSNSASGVLRGSPMAGVAGAIAPPIAARVAGKGFARGGTIACMVLAAAGFVLSSYAVDASNLSLGIVVAAAIMIDFAASANLVFGQRAIFPAGPGIAQPLKWALSRHVLRIRRHQRSSERLVLRAFRMGVVSRRSAYC